MIRFDLLAKCNYQHFVLLDNILACILGFILNAVEFLSPRIELVIEFALDTN